MIRDNAVDLNGRRTAITAKIVNPQLLRLSPYLRAGLTNMIRDNTVGRNKHQTVKIVNP